MRHHFRFKYTNKLKVKDWTEICHASLGCWPHTSHLCLHLCVASIYEGSSLITSTYQSPHQLIPSSWTLEFQHKNLGAEDTNIQTIALGEGRYGD